MLKLTENLPYTEESELEYIILGEWFDTTFEMTVASGWDTVIDAHYLMELIQRFEDYKPQLKLGFS